MAGKMVTGQVKLDSYIDAGVFAAVTLVNGLTKGFAGGKSVDDIEPLSVIRCALAVDPVSLSALTERDAPGFIAVEQRPASPRAQY